MKSLCLGCILLLILFSACGTENNQIPLDVERQKEILEIKAYIRNNPFPI
jgi:hypothetical protein